MSRCHASFVGGPFVRRCKTNRPDGDVRRGPGGPPHGSMGAHSKLQLVVATQPKTLLRRSGSPFPASSQIANLAERRALAAAQNWFTQERAWINEQHLELCRIAAPTFFEQPRAEWFRDRLS